MGNRGARETNRMLREQTAAANRFAQQMGGYGAEDRAYGTRTREDIDRLYQELYGQAGEMGGGGGGGPAYTALQYADPRENEAMAFYRQLQQTGGWSTPEMQDFRARATSTMPSFFEGLRNQLSAQQAGGGSVGYSSQMAKLARDASRGAADVQLGAETDLAERIRSGRERGAGGVERLDEALIGRQMQVERERLQEQRNAQAAASAAAGRRRTAADEAFRNRMAILGERRGLRGESGSDLPYFDRQLAGMGQATGTIGARVPEQSFLGGVMGGLTGLAGAAAPFVPLVGRGRSRPSGGGKG